MNQEHSFPIWCPNQSVLFFMNDNVVTKSPNPLRLSNIEVGENPPKRSMATPRSKPKFHSPGTSHFKWDSIGKLVPRPHNAFTQLHSYRVITLPLAHPSQIAPYLLTLLQILPSSVVNLQCHFPNNSLLNTSKFISPKPPYICFHALFKSTK